MADGKKNAARIDAARSQFGLQRRAQNQRRDVVQVVFAVFKICVVGRRERLERVELSCGATPPSRRVFVHFAVERFGGGGREPRRVHSFLTREPETRARLVRVATRDKTRVVEFTRYCATIFRRFRRLD